MFNKVVLVGNLTRDIEMRHSQSGTAIAKTGIATNRKFKSQSGEQKEEVMFVDLTFFGRTAEVAQQYLHRGSKILVDGRLVFDQWTDQNGQKRSKHGITVDLMQMLDSKGDNIGSTTTPSQNMNTSYTSPSNNQIVQNTYNQRGEVPPTHTTPIQEQVPEIDMSHLDNIPF